jgi:hypothetical protein
MGGRKAKLSIVFIAGLAASLVLCFRGRIPILRPDMHHLLDDIANPNVPEQHVLYKLWWLNNPNASYSYDQPDGKHTGTLVSVAASRGERGEILEWLLDHGADPNPPGDSPLYAAIGMEYPEMAKRLLSAGARWSAPIKDGTSETVREWATKNRPEILRELAPHPSGYIRSRR